MSSEELDLDATIERLVSVKNSKPGTEVNLPEDDIIWLCRKSREVSVGVAVAVGAAAAGAATAT